MKATDFWKNFKLGEELSISGVFIYNGIRRFHELHKLDHADDIFEVLYNLSVGIERLMKIAIVLLEHNDAMDQTDFEQTLITHSHDELYRRIVKRAKLKLSTQHTDFLHVLTTFYKTHRYDRFSLSSAWSLKREKHALLDFLEKHLNVELKDRTSAFGHRNDTRYKSFLRRIVTKISSELYDVVRTRASELNLYTYELRSGSKAETVFLGGADIASEEVLWKELLIFFMNTEQTSGYLEFLRAIEPLGFDPGSIADYLDCFQSDSAKANVMDELEHLYQEEVGNVEERLATIGVIGAPGASFDDDDYCDDDDEEFVDPGEEFDDGKGKA